MGLSRVGTVDWQPERLPSPACGHTTGLAPWKR